MTTQRNCHSPTRTSAPRPGLARGRRSALGRAGAALALAMAVALAGAPGAVAVDEITTQEYVAALGVEKVWANPDCGLKTRAYAETEASLRHLVEAARRVRP